MYGDGAAILLGSGPHGPHAVAVRRQAFGIQRDRGLAVVFKPQHHKTVLGVNRRADQPLFRVLQGLDALGCIVQRSTHQRADIPRGHKVKQMPVGHTGKGNGVLLAKDLLGRKQCIQHRVAGLVPGFIVPDAGFHIRQGRGLFAWVLLSPDGRDLQFKVMAVAVDQPDAFLALLVLFVLAAQHAVHSFQLPVEGVFPQLFLLHRKHQHPGQVPEVFGLKEGMIVIMIHSGSRGCGHQVCSDYLRLMDKAYKNHNIDIPDRQLACAPLDTHEAQDYLKAMYAAANYAWANRQMMTHWIRETFEEVMGKSAKEMDMGIVYDVAHNIAKKEVHKLNGRDTTLIVHRKGATRAFGPGREEVPEKYREVGQPVLIPGTMGTASYVLHGTDVAMEETFGSTAHGAGRVLSRTQAKKDYKGEDIEKSLNEKGIKIKATSPNVIAEEAPEAYKDVDSVVRVSDETGIAKLVAKVSPLAVTKG